MMDNHKGELDKTKEEYNKLKKTMDELSVVLRGITDRLG
jgi:hypothetical protein